MFDSVFDWFSGSALNCLYGGALGIGLLYSLVLIFFQGLGDVFSGLDSVLDIFNIDVDFDHGAGDGSGISLLAITTFISAFGAFGLASRGIFEAGVFASIGSAILGGIVFGGLAQVFFVYVLSPTTNSLVNQASLQGRVAEVILPIPENGNGQIMLIVQGSRVTYTARAENHQPIARGTEVRIERILGSVATVTPVDEYNL